MIIRTLFNKGSRVPLRGKVNEAVTTGVRVVDTILPIGRGQRQLIIGDRFTGKTSIKVKLLLWAKVKEITAIGFTEFNLSYTLNAFQIDPNGV